ncbi:chorion peroxidase-like [Liolophura sinensis]|uniref:chorion peroxidase-like n=1 Tax=Liolophura sinensis TaxID=3198878 RepID=UPI003157F725
MRCLWVVGVLMSVLIAISDCKPNVNIKNLTKQAEDNVNNEDKLYQERFEAKIDILPEDLTTVTAALFEETPDRAAEIEKQSRLVNWLSYLLRKSGGSVSLSEALALTGIECPFKPPESCPSSKYRSLDGVCNNKAHPLRGAAFTPFAREIPPAYEQDPSPEGLDDFPRCTAKSGQLLPSAREISRKVHQQGPSSSNAETKSFFFVAWGQFVAHLITDRAPASGFKSARVDCCNLSKKAPPSECFNIDLADDDPYRSVGRSCLGFLRSLEATDIDCKTGRREQLNSATSFIDGSAVYGVTEENAKSLRTFSGGKLVVSEPNQLPYNCNNHPLAAKRGFNLFSAGDPRVNEVSHLIGVHTVWVREHNRIATKLASLNPSWKDETLYQETRRIVSALIQHISYKEWLPIVLGNDIMTKYNLSVLSSGFYDQYDENVNPATTSVTASVAMRFGHTLVSPLFRVLPRDYSQGSTPALTLGSLFFRPNLYVMHEQGLMRGLLADPSQNMDPFVEFDLTNRLFETARGNGMDLAAFNIQRGRDNGIPSYNEWRRKFNLPVGTSFSAGLPGIPDNLTKTLESVYGDPEDIDLYSGALCETREGGAAVGPLFAEILGQQFSNFRKGDRFWYETNESPQAFTAAQLTQIRGVTLAEVLCNNLDLDTIQPAAFLLPAPQTNARVACSTIQQFDLTPWRSH